MAARDDDWRLTNQGRYLSGCVLEYARYSPQNPANDHDHCEFCWERFMAADLPPADARVASSGEAEGVLHSGYTTADRYRWICEQCFEDFKDRFKWQLAKSKNPVP